jgi:putative tricarboxylic transport membrane protein
MDNKRRLHAGEQAFTMLLLVFSLAVLVMAYRISEFQSVSSPGTFPMFAAAVMVYSLICLLLDNRKADKPRAEALASELGHAMRDIFQPVFLIYTAIIIAYMIALQPLHFLPSSFLFLLGSILFLKGSSPLKAVVISIGLLGAIYLIFHYVFRVVLA